MKRAFTFVVAALSSATALSGQAVTTSKFDVAGIPVIFKPVRANDVVAVRLYLRGGSANENESPGSADELRKPTGQTLVTVLCALGREARGYASARACAR